MAKMQDMAMKMIQQGAPALQDSPTVFPKQPPLAALAAIRSPMVPTRLGAIPLPDAGAIEDRRDVVAVGDHRRADAAVGCRTDDASVGGDRRGEVTIVARRDALVPVGVRPIQEGGSSGSGHVDVAPRADDDGDQASRDRRDELVPVGDVASSAAKTSGACPAPETTKPKIAAMLDDWADMQKSRTARKTEPSAEAAPPKMPMKRPAAAGPTTPAKKAATTPAKKAAPPAAASPRTPSHAKPQVNHEGSRSQYLVRFGHGMGSKAFKYSGPSSQKKAKQSADAALAKFLKKSK